MSFLDHFEGKGRWAFNPWFGLSAWFILLLLIAASWIGLGLQPIMGAVVALLGALMACLGAFTVARPVIRAGGYRIWLEKQSVIGGASYVPTPEEQVEMPENAKDSLAVNILGPALAIGGTLTNGLSGFLPA